MLCWCDVKESPTGYCPVKAVLPGDIPSRSTPTSMIPPSAPTSTYFPYAQPHYYPPHHLPPPPYHAQDYQHPLSYHSHDLHPANALYGQHINIITQPKPGAADLAQHGPYSQYYNHNYRYLSYQPHSQQHTLFPQQSLENKGLYSNPKSYREASQVDDQEDVFVLSNAFRNLLRQNAKKRAAKREKQRYEKLLQQQSVPSQAEIYVSDQKRAQSLYGKAGAAQITTLEASLNSKFDTLIDKMQPGFYPVVPLNTKR